MKDVLGSEIKEGSRAIRVDLYGQFHNITILKVNPDESKRRGPICFITDGKSKQAYTHAERIIVQDSLKVKI